VFVIYAFLLFVKSIQYIVQVHLVQLPLHDATKCSFKFAHLRKELCDDSDVQVDVLNCLTTAPFPAHPFSANFVSATRWRWSCPAARAAPESPAAGLRSQAVATASRKGQIGGWRRSCVTAVTGQWRDAGTRQWRLGDGAGGHGGAARLPELAQCLPQLRPTGAGGAARRRCRHGGCHWAGDGMGGGGRA